MKVLSSHPSPEQLTDMAQGRLPPDELAQAQAHIDACERCAGKLAQRRQVIGLMGDDFEHAPPDVIARAVGLLRQRWPGAAPAGLSRRIAAALRFDSLRQPALAIRSGQPAARQMLYEAEGIDVDLRIAPSGGSWAIAGQVLGQGAGGEAILQGPAGSARAALNELSRFRLPPVPPGNYTLVLLLDQIEIEISKLEVGI